MIDWLRFVIPCHHSHPINGGRVLKIDQNNDIQWEVISRLQVRGSHESTIQVRTQDHNPDGTGSTLYIDGNPVKWLQGHNLWGTDDLLSLVYAFMERLAPLVGAFPTEADRLAWSLGGYEIKAIDLNRTWHLRNRADVLAWLRSAEHCAHLRHRGKGMLQGGCTLYFGKNSRRWALKCYSKGLELEAKDHRLPLSLQLPSLIDWANKSLRIELRMLSLELKRLGLHVAANWGDNTVLELHQAYLEGLEMNDAHTLPNFELPDLPPRLLGAYQLWKDGHDLRSIYPRKTFYRYRLQLLEHGIDIAVVQPKEKSNVVPLIRVLEAMPVGIPDWAIGTDLYFDPPKLVVNGR